MSSLFSHLGLALKCDTWILWIVSSIHSSHSIYNEQDLDSQNQHGHKHTGCRGSGLKLIGAYLATLSQASQYQPDILAMCTMEVLTNMHSKWMSIASSGQFLCCCCWYIQFIQLYVQCIFVLMDILSEKINH